MARVKAVVVLDSMLSFPKEFFAPLDTLRADAAMVFVLITVGRPLAVVAEHHKINQHVSSPFSSGRAGI